MQGYGGQNFFGTDGPNFGPASLETLEDRILAGDVDAVNELNSSELERVMKETQQQAVAVIILDLGDDVLVRKLMEKYTYGHQGDEWLEEHRREGMEDHIKRLRKIAKF